MPWGCLGGCEKGKRRPASRARGADIEREVGFAQAMEVVQTLTPSFGCALGRGAALDESFLHDVDLGAALDGFEGDGHRHLVALGPAGHVVLELVRVDDLLERLELEVLATKEAGPATVD